MGSIGNLANRSVSLLSIRLFAIANSANFFELEERSPAIFQESRESQECDRILLLRCKTLGSYYQFFGIYSYASL